MAFSENFDGYINSIKKIKNEGLSLKSALSFLFGNGTVDSYKGEKGIPIKDPAQLQNIKEINEAIKNGLTTTPEFTEKLEKLDKPVQKLYKDSGYVVQSLIETGEGAVIGASGLEELKLKFDGVKKVAKAAAIEFGKFLAISVAISLLTKVAGHLYKQIFQLDEVAADAADAWESTKKELEDVNSELETTRDRIEELEGKAALTLTEQEELDRLRKQNDLLERRLALLREEEEIKRREATNAALAALAGNGNVSYGYSNAEAGGAPSTNNSSAEQIQKELALYKKAQEEINALDPTNANYKANFDRLDKEMQGHYDKMVTLATEANTQLLNIDTSLLTEGQLKSFKEVEHAINSVLLVTGEMSSVDILGSVLDERGIQNFEDGIKTLVNSTAELPNDEKLLEELGITEAELNEAGISVDNLKEHIIALREAGEITVEPTLADKYNLSGAISELTTLETKFNALTEAYKEASDNGEISLGKLNEISTEFDSIKDTDEFVKAMDVLGDSKSTLAEVEAAMNSLVNTYVDSKEVLTDLNEENKDLYISKLQQMGVTNALEVVEFRLAQKRLMNAEAGSEEANAALRVMNAYSQTGRSIYLMGEESVGAAEKLKLVEIYLNGVTRENFRGAILGQADALMKVAVAAGKSAGILATYLEVCEKIERLSNKKGKTVEENRELNYARLQAHKLESQAYDEYNDLFRVDIDYNYRPTSSSAYNSGSGSGSGSGSDSKTNFDWIETAISRIQRAITNLEKQVGNTFKSWSSRNSALTKQLSKVREEIELQQRAYNAYMSEANAIGLSSSWVKKVQSGAYNIDTLTDKDLIEKIQNYKDWYEKALACQDAIDDLRIKESELYKQKFDDVIARYDGYLSVIEHEKSMLEASISETETRGYLVSAKYYEALIEAEGDNIDNLEDKRKELISALNEGINAGAIEKYSQEWYDLNGQINDVTLAIKEGTTAVIEYGNAIRELEWEVFDLLQENISDVNDEANFLIELLSHDKLYNDKGQLTDAGMSTMGLHGVNYNVLMAQADEYAKEIQDIDKLLANDPNNQTLLERRKELLELQRESITAAEQEKEAIRDMVSEGIQLELDALQELIDTYNEALDSQKDLYDYQKKIAEQVKEVATLEKQLAAYSGDDSEETQSKIQQIKVDLEAAREALEESEYEKYISDQKALLDSLYLEYETILNQRLDNLDFLISDMVEKINQNGDIISATITEAADNVGYTLSESMNTIWNEDDGIGSIIVTYSDKIAGNISAMDTSVNAALNNIASKIQAMIDESHKDANDNSGSSGGTSSGTSGGGTNSGTSSGASSSSSSKPSVGTKGDGVAKVGDKVKFATGIYFNDSYGGGPSGYYKRGNEVYITAINKSATYPYHISSGSKLGVGDLGWLKLSQLAGYFAGKKNIQRAQFAWTQESGQAEYIIRPSDGAILTPLQPGDHVLKPLATQNIWNMANNPSEFIKDNLSSEMKSLLSKNYGSNGNIAQNFDKIIFNMPNVKNYEEMLAQMQRDKNFEKLLKAITIDPLVGRSSLAKNKVIKR